MDRLASCYFCGDAFDASLSEYPVVPKTLQSTAEDGPTVVLCGACRRKLGAVMDEVVAATDGDVATDDRGEQAAVTNGARSDDSSPLDDGAGSESATTADEWEAPVDDEAASAESDVSEDATTEHTAESTEPTDTSRAESDDTETAASSPAASDDSETTAASAGASDDPTLTKLEYNKVMRLLKNRPFPVDKGEIRDVATSAYEISPGEFDAVIEAAVERDLIAVENGQFVDPE